MFSELCRETLRKAAVCYSTGRTGSPSSSPPTSPPPSPAKEAKTCANIELANVNGANDQVGESFDGGARNYLQGSTTTSTNSREISYKNKSNSIENTEKRFAMLTNFKRRSRRERRRFHHYSNADETRECSSSSCDHEYRRECCRRDSSGSSTDYDDSSTSEDEAGAVSEDTNQRSSSAHNRHSLTKDSKRRSLYDEDSLDGDSPNDKQGRESSLSAKDSDRIRLVHDRRYEERQKKLITELKERAESTQKFVEKLDKDRRKRQVNSKIKDNDRRSQVEVRKLQIEEAEKSRKIAILQKNQEREARIEAKKRNERSNIVFAFGSSTPRMLEPADTGGSFWGGRKATSTTNVMTFPHTQPLTRRSSERELDGSKKRATSAGGLVRQPGEDMRMSSSMYEVFNWNSNSDPPITPAKNKRASLSLPPTTDIFAIDDKFDSDTRRTTMQWVASGEDVDGAPDMSSSVFQQRIRRRTTDLRPTIPLPRDGPSSSSRSPNTKAFTRSPGRTYSMSRLDQLAQPRKGRSATGELSTLTEQQQQPQERQGTQTLGASSMSRSMSHLAAPGAKSLKRSDNSRSMGTLPGAVVNPRVTRAVRLRRQARDLAQQPQQGTRSGEVTPNSPSRPHSSMSQQSGSSVGSNNVTLRPRTTTPRRPRPASIAGTGVTATERHNSKPPLPKGNITPKKSMVTTTPRSSTVDSTKKLGERMIRSIVKSSPRNTPKATPLQSPGAEQLPLIRQDTTEIIRNDHNSDNMKIIEDKQEEEKKDQGSEKSDPGNETNNDVTVESTTTNIVEATPNTIPEGEAPAAIREAKDEENKSSIKETDMSVSMTKVRITTEEEAKLALLMQRRKVKLEMDREAVAADYERHSNKVQEIEELHMKKMRFFRQEQERIMKQEADEERERLEKLQQETEEIERAEKTARDLMEEKRLEDARLKQEREDADRKMREEQERQRIEMFQRLKKEEEERFVRRKRVEDIMKRTRRANNQENATSKGDDGNSDNPKDESPSEESKPVFDSEVDTEMTTSLISEATQDFINIERQSDGNKSPNGRVHNGAHSNGINENNARSLETNQDNVDEELNGHHTNHGNGIHSESIALDNATVNQNNVTNNLLDLSEFDTLSNSSRGPILKLPSNLANEDSLNSNLNPTAMPFTPMVNPFVSSNATTNPFQDAFTNNKNQDNNQVPDLLS